MAPKGYAHAIERRAGIIGCGYDGSLSAAHALETAHRVAAATGARLRVIRAFTPLALDTAAGQRALGGSGLVQRHAARARYEELEDAVAKLDGEPGPRPFFAVGDAAQILAEASEQLDLLVLGSRGYGPLHAVLVGGVAGASVREAACPVIVLPRRAGHTEADSLFATEYTGSSKRVRVPVQPGVHRIQASAVLVKAQP